MQLTTEGSVLRVTGPGELTANNATPFREQVRAALREDHNQIDLEFGSTRFVDSSGLGVLISLQKVMRDRHGRIRVVSPTSQVQQILELTRLHRLFEIVQAG
jgi:anti-sigma B factor antagonist